MNQHQHFLIPVATAAGLVVLLMAQADGADAISAEFRSKPRLYVTPPGANLHAESQSISEATVSTIENWLMGEPSARGQLSVLGDPFIDSPRKDAVLAQPNAKSELAKIVARQDLPPELRVYAQEILLTTGAPPNPLLVEAYCQTLPNGFRHDVWAYPGMWVGGFGQTLVGYGQAALPCLRRLLDNNNKIGYNAGERGAVAEACHYRVSDLAAYLTTQILNLPYTDHSSPVVRDQFIRYLRQHLDARSH